MQTDHIYLLNKRVRLEQPEKGFRTSIDAVLLAAACPVKPKESVLDMGCGVGGASFCLMYRVQDCILTGIDVHEDYIKLAEKNIQINGTRGRSRFIRADVLRFDVSDKETRYDHVICNPPYHEAGAHQPSPDKAKALAMGHGQREITLKEWIDAAFRVLKNNGSFTMIHRADAVDRIIRGMGNRFGAIEIIPLWPKAGQPAKRVIIRAVKDRKSPSIIHPGVTLHKEDGEYTAEADEVLRSAQALL